MLSSVGKHAAGQISVSRLQLALRGLESEEPLVRVAGMWTLFFWAFGVLFVGN